MTETLPEATPGRGAGPGAAVPPRAECAVDLDAIRHNVGLLAGLAGAGTTAGGRTGAAVMAVVKADGYGHGAVAVARAALTAGATWLGVCTLDEAAELRAAGLRSPMLTWLVPVDEDRAPAIADDVDLTVASRAELDAVVAGAHRAGRRARVHLKIDTGLSRNGCSPEEWAELLGAVAAAGDTVEPWAVWSHLAHADAPRHGTLDRQAARLDAAWKTARTHLGVPLRRHLANSAATLTRPDLHLDLVRPGIAVYGLDPVGADDGFGLRPAMTFRSRVVLVKSVAADEGVSYGHEWTTPDERVLALVPVGYADGVPRGLGGAMSVQLAGHRRPVVGRVCMDQVVVDCGPAGTRSPAEPDQREPSGPGVRVGDEVLLFGPGTRGEPTAADWAEELGTIHYEVVTAVGCRPRVTRTASGGTSR